MAATLRVLIVVLAVVSVSLRRAAAAVTVDEACKQYTKYPELCVKSLSSAKPEDKAAAEQGGLAKLSELSLLRAAQMLSETVKLANGLESRPGARPPPCLQECLASVGGALTDLMMRPKVAVEEAKVDVGAVNTQVSAAKVDGDSCLPDCQKLEGGAEKQIVAKMNDIGKMCSIIMSLNDASRNHTAAV